MKRSITKVIAGAIIVTGIYAGCKPEKFEGNGLTSNDLQAAFNVTPVPGKPNYYILKADTKGVLAVKWDTGDGAAISKSVDTVFFPDAGNYSILLTAIGKGGVSKTSTQQLTVSTSDPSAGNLVKGANMGTGDDAFWNHITISSGVTFAIEDGKMVAKGGNNGHAAVWQAIDVVASRTYKVDMNVSGSGATDTWFEVYVGTKQPVNGQDYSDGGARIALNTWAGCGKTAFNGKLTSISCAGSGNTLKFDKSGTVYLLIKSGGSNLGLTGIGFNKVTFRGVN